MDFKRNDSCREYTELRFPQTVEHRSMGLNNLWTWEDRKLACRIRTENGNPGLDNLRETFEEMRGTLAQLAGVDINEMLSELRAQKKKREATSKVTVDREAEQGFKEILGKARVLGAAKLALERIEEGTTPLGRSMTAAQRNVHRLYSVVPKSPPRRVVLDIQRERSKPLHLPVQGERSVATDKLEKKLAKQRAARMAAIEQSTKDDGVVKSSNKTVEAVRLGLAKSDAFVKYNGDLFSTGGSYLEGMLYLSRVPEESSVPVKDIRTLLKFGGETGKKMIEQNTTDSQEKGIPERDGFGKKEEEASIGELSTNPDTNAKFSCAASLCNWARNPTNAHRLASEGAVRAIMQLSLETVFRIKVFCAAAFRFMSDQQTLAVSMIEEGAITTISELVATYNDEFMTYNLAIALVNLTRVNGKEGQVVEAAIVLALMNLISLKPELGIICVRGLYNLTCVDVSYPSIERVIRALVTLSLSGTSNIKHLCAAALCNLSDLKSVRPRMVEEGAINVLSPLSRGAETRTRRICAVILQNLSAAKSVRVEMASRNSVTATYGLSSDQDPIILRCIGLTLSRLAMEPSNCQRIILENGISALCNIAVKYPSIPGITQPVASAFQLLSVHDDYRVNMVAEGCVTAIASLLRNSADMFTLQHSLLALCNLLCKQDNHLPIIQQGLILTLISMCSHENSLVKDFCSLAFLNLSSTDDSRKHLVSAGAVTAIIAIAKQDSDLTQKRCAATFCNLSYYSAGMTRMVADGIIASIADLVVAKDILTVHYSCAALCRLCSTKENARLILDSGAVPNLVRGAIEGDHVTKQFCGSVLSSLSFYEYCRIPLCEFNAISALKGLSSLKDLLTRQRCLVAFANLSCEISVQQKMIAAGVISIIAELAQSLQEINYICCAKAICNLACCEGMKSAVAREGGVHALLLISMVQSVDPLTKLLCVLGLNNLLDDTTIDFMLGEGLVGSIATLSTSGDAHISNLCAKILNHLSRYPSARQKMVERRSNLNALFKMCDSKTFETQIVAMRTACNLLIDRQVRGVVMKAGVMVALEIGIGLADQATSMHCLQSIFSLTDDDSLMEQMVGYSVVDSMANLLHCPELKTDAFDLVCKSLAMLAYCKRSRFYLQRINFLTSVLHVLSLENLRESSTGWLLTTICFLTDGYSDVDDLLAARVLPLILRSGQFFAQQLQKGSYQGGLVAIVEVLYTLSESTAGIVEMAREAATTLNLILLTAKHCRDTSTFHGADSSFSASWILYHASIILYRFSSSEGIVRTNTARSETSLLVEVLVNEEKCAEILAAAIGIYLMDQKSRAVFANAGLCAAIIKISEYNLSGMALSNLVLAIYALSKVTASREFMMQAPIQPAIDRLLQRTLISENAKIRANTSRTLKNLNSDLHESIEEGAVANLIAMSLEGKLKNQASDEFSTPTLLPRSDQKLSAPSCKAEIHSDEDRAISFWFAKVVVTKGGAAGKGPEPPSPPKISADGSADALNMLEELDGGELEGRTKMAFAKMQIPANMREAYLLTDTDFMLTLSRDEVTGTEPSIESTSDAPPASPEPSNSPPVPSPDSPKREKPELVRAPSNPRGLSRGSSQRGGLSRASTTKSGEDIKLSDSEGRDSRMAINSTDPAQLRRGKRGTKGKDDKRASPLSDQAAKIGLYA